MEPVTRPFSLIEVLIGLSLTLVILGFLFFAMHTQTMLRARTEQMHSQVMAELNVQQRIDNLFLHLASFHMETTQERSAVLHFKTKKGVDSDVSFSGGFEGYLSIERIDGLSCFCLTQIARVGKEERREILLKGIEEIACEFLQESDEDFMIEKSWDKEKKRLPRFIELTLTARKKSPLVFVFWASAQKKPILYPPKKVFENLSN